MKKYNRRQFIKLKVFGFTLVELITTVSIISILVTVSYMSYASYMKGVRDSNRLGQIVAIHDALKLYQVKHIIPLPDEFIEIRNHDKVIAYQGYAGKNVLKTIGYEGNGKDPDMNIHFTYYVTANRKHFQLLTYFEEHYMFNSVYAHDYLMKTPIVYGDKLGVMSNQHNAPLQEDHHTVEEGYFDFSHAHDDFISHFQQNGSLYAGAHQMHIIAEIVEKGIDANSCLTWIFSNPELKGLHNYYYLNDANQNSYEGFCSWGDIVEEQEETDAPFTQYLTGIVVNGDFLNGENILGAVPSSNGNNKIIIMSSPMESGYVLFQKGPSSSQYTISLTPDIIAQLLPGDIIRMSAWVADTSGYIFKNIIEYTDGSNDSNGELIITDTKTIDGRDWEHQQVDHLVGSTPISFQWYLGEESESSPKKIYISGVNIEILRQQ